jgi:hypothetical protein
MASPAQGGGCGARLYHHDWSSRRDLDVTTSWTGMVRVEEVASRSGRMPASPSADQRAVHFCTTSMVTSPRSMYWRRRDGDGLGDLDERVGHREGAAALDAGVGPVLVDPQVHRGRPVARTPLGDPRLSSPSPSWPLPLVPFPLAVVGGALPVPGRCVSVFVPSRPPRALRSVPSPPTLAVLLLPRPDSCPSPPPRSCNRFRRKRLRHQATYGSAAAPTMGAATASVGSASGGVSRRRRQGCRGRRRRW